MLDQGAARDAIMLNPYRLTLPVTTNIIVKPDAHILPYTGSYQAFGPAVLTPGPSNIVNPTILDPGQGVQQTVQPATPTLPAPPTDTQVPDSSVATETGVLPWIKAHPGESIGIALALYFVGKEIFKPKRRRK